MAWTAPRTWTAGEVPSASIMNTHLRDNFLELAPAKMTAAGDLVYATAADTLARLAPGSSRSSLVTNPAATAPVWLPELVPWWLEVWPYEGSVGNTNWSTKNNRGDDFHYGQSLQSTGAQNAEIYWYITLAKGTYTLTIDFDFSGSTSDLGIVHVRLDDVDLTTYDSYGQPVVAYGSRRQLAGLVIATTGRKKFALKMATKNASSSNYYGKISHLVWIRTA